MRPSQPGIQNAYFLVTAGTQSLQPTIITRGTVKYIYLQVIYLTILQLQEFTFQNGRFKDNDDLFVLIKVYLTFWEVAIMYIYVFTGFRLFH